MAKTKKPELYEQKHLEGRKRHKDEAKRECAKVSKLEKSDHKVMKQTKSEVREKDKKGMKRWKANDMFVTNKTLQKVRTEK